LINLYKAPKRRKWRKFNMEDENELKGKRMDMAFGMWEGEGDYGH
jgi:hypothetical protein